MLSKNEELATMASQLQPIAYLLDSQVFSFMKFFDPLAEEDDPSNYYMEREWRLYGNLQFSLVDVSRVTLPIAYVDRFKEDVPTFRGTVTKSEEAV